MHRNTGTGTGFPAGGSQRRELPSFGFVSTGVAVGNRGFSLNDRAEDVIVAIVSSTTSFVTERLESFVCFGTS